MSGEPHDERSRGVHAVVDGPDAELVVQLLGEVGVPAVVGPVVGCPTCQFFDCVCAVRANHAETCRFRKAMCCPVGIECEHGYDVCPTCDPCDCGASR